MGKSQESNHCWLPRTLSLSQKLYLVNKVKKPESDCVTAHVYGMFRVKSDIDNVNAPILKELSLLVCPKIHQ